MTNGGNTPNRRPDIGKRGQPQKPTIRVLVPKPPLPLVNEPVLPPLPPPPPPMPESLRRGLSNPAQVGNRLPEAIPQFQRSVVPEKPPRQPKGAQAVSIPATPAGTGIATDAATAAEPDESDLPSRRSWLPTNWVFWSVIGVMLTTGIGGFSVALLLKLPAIPNCPAIFWPTASASLRLYCAEVAANKQTVDDLLEAIDLVNSLPANHALRLEVNRRIEGWSTEILDLSEAAFHRGELEDAIDTARRIPANTTAATLVEERIQHWQAIWAKAESIYEDAKAALTQQDLRQAFTLAVQLLDLDNEYWKTTRYQELNTLIAAYRQDGGKLDRARSLARRGGLSNLLAAVKAVQELSQNSPLYAEAQQLIKEFGRDMLGLAEAALDRRDASEAIDIARQIPEAASLEREVADLTDLAAAQQQAANGTVADLEAAIIQAQRLRENRPLYDKAQRLVSRWQLEIEDINRLERARQIAQNGTSGDLTAAIAEAQLIPRRNPRGSDARREIAAWTSQVEEMEDRPRLDQAEQFAQNGDIVSLQQAIAEASQIAEGRSLYAEARRQIQTWTRRVEELQDQPYLDQARQLAISGNLPAAIAAAEQIRSGRALHRDAQAEIRTWRDQSQNQARLQQAYQAAGVGTTSGLITAIRVADQIPADSSLRNEADRMITFWSQSVLRAAQEQAAYDLLGAIATAESIPPRTEAYEAAQLQLQEWRQRLTPTAMPAAQPTLTP
jgi:soluble cytochrome b562